MIFQNFGFNQNYPVSGVAPVVSGIQPLAISSSLYAYYDIAFTSSYSGSGQTTVFDLSGNNKSGSVVGTWNYNTAGISGSVLRLGTSSNSNRVEMPSLTLSGSVTFVTAWYMTSGSYQFDFIDLFGGTDPEYYGMFIGNNAGNSSRVLPSINDVYDISATTSGIPSGSASSGSWHISQFSFNDTTNIWNWAMDGITGSYTQAAAMTNGTITPKFNFDNGSLPNRFLNSGSMMQVMALYTGSLSTAELLQNHNGLKARYGL
jgi:hypothetical protein